MRHGPVWMMESLFVSLHMIYTLSMLHIVSPPPHSFGSSLYPSVVSGFGLSIEAI